MGRKVFVVGVGMTKFEKPGSKAWDYPDMAKEAGDKALADAGIPYDAIEQAAVGYCYGDSTCGQRAVYQLGLTGVPIYNVNNNCATGSTALFMVKQFVEAGLADTTMNKIYDDPLLIYNFESFLFQMKSCLDVFSQLLAYSSKLESTTSTKFGDDLRCFKRNCRRRVERK
jgi:hypothetical protein